MSRIVDPDTDPDSGPDANRESDDRTDPGHKRSYTIPCASDFRRRVLALAEAREVNAADLARSVILILPQAMIAAAPDPGDPEPDDREQVSLQSGPDKGKPWRRKPRLQVRLPAGYDPILLRKALGLSLSLEERSLRLTLEPAGLPPRVESDAKARAEIERLRNTVRILAGERLSNAVRTKDEALFVLGFPPGSRPGAAAIKARFRLLATIHHPDSDTGDTARMAQLNQAMSFMRAYESN